MVPVQLGEQMMTKVKNQSKVSFDRGYKWLHWSMAALFLLMFLALQGFANAKTDADRMTMLVGHSSIGTIISILLLIRIIKRFVRRSPRPIHNVTLRQKAIAKFVQLALYFFMIFVPLTGYLTASVHELPVMVFGVFDFNEGARISYDHSVFEIIRAAHEYGIYSLMVLLMVHIGAALYHRLIKKDDVLASMTRYKKV